MQSPSKGRFEARWLLALVLIMLFLPVSCSDVDDLQAPESIEDPTEDDSVPQGFWDAYKDRDGDDLYHHVTYCTVCHDVFGPQNNLRFVPDTISTPNSGDRVVRLFARQGPNSFADGDTIYDGVCEVCHTATNHHRNNESGDHTHYAGNDCIVCHTHYEEFSPTGGGSGPGHVTHTSGDPHGLALSCDYCHTSNPSTFQDGEPFETTTVCNPCHSPDGPIDGVNDSTIGAKVNWTTGVYDGEVLQSGKERWCGGCHDAGSSVVDSVAAPPVAGDGTWGFYASGHGRNDAVACTDCHDPMSTHIDGEEQTYSAAADNYVAGFRLALLDGAPPLTVPRNGFDWDDAYADPPYFDLCFSCHDKHRLLGSPTAPSGPYNIPEILTNFRSDSIVVIADGNGTNIAGYSVSGAVARNSHYRHLTGPPLFYDSDRDLTNDSYGTCVACHNVHGSASPAMIRDGKLIAHEPGLNYGRSRYDRHNPPQGGCGDPIVMTTLGVGGDESQGGVMRANSGPAANGVCNFCHCGGAATGDPEYIINCYDPDCVDYYRVWTEPVLPLER